MAKPRLVEGLVLSSLLLACASPPKPPEAPVINSLQKPGVVLLDGTPVSVPTAPPNLFTNHINIRAYYQERRFLSIKQDCIIRLVNGIQDRLKVRLDIMDLVIYFLNMVSVFRFLLIDCFTSSNLPKQPGFDVSLDK